jgi:hypothetical protein
MSLKWHKQNCKWIFKCYSDKVAAFTVLGASLKAISNNYTILLKTIQLHCGFTSILEVQILFLCNTRILPQNRSTLRLRHYVPLNASTHVPHYHNNSTTLQLHATQQNLNTFATVQMYSSHYYVHVQTNPILYVALPWYHPSDYQLTV